MRVVLEPWKDGKKTLLKSSGSKLYKNIESFALEFKKYLFGFLGMKEQVATIGFGSYQHKL